MNVLSEILSGATAAINKEYFILQVAENAPVYRERVYCYELYHQMRRKWPEKTALRLNGEIDKAAHSLLTTLPIKVSKPDLLVHLPGSMESNAAIIEVKRVCTTKPNIIKDLVTLSDFREKANYQRAIYLFYGHEKSDKVMTKVMRACRGLTLKFPIEIWLHSEVGVAASLIDTLPAR